MCSLGQFLCSRIGGSKRAISDRRPDRVFLRSRKSAFSIPIVAIEQSDPHIPSRKSTFSTGCVDRNCSIEKIFQAHRISHHPTKHTITPYNSSDRCWLDCYSTAAAAAHNDSAWHILFSARQQRVPSSEKHQFVLSMTFLQHCCCSSCCCALFGDSRRSPTPQPRR